MELFHISFRSIKQFVPRVPQHRIQGEDNTVKRICFSENVKKAINASPCGGNILKGILICRTIVTPIVHVYVCNTEDNPKIQFIQPDVVYNTYHVRDAEFTREWWALGIPKIKHFIFRVNYAKMQKFTDQLGNDGNYIYGIDILFLERLPNNAPELWIKHTPIRDIDLEDVFNFYGEQIRN